jgi:hypothetical protein
MTEDNRSKNPKIHQTQISHQQNQLTVPLENSVTNKGETNFCGPLK